MCITFILKASLLTALIAPCLTQDVSTSTEASTPSINGTDPEKRFGFFGFGDFGAPSWQNGGLPGQIPQNHNHKPGSTNAGYPPANAGFGGGFAPNQNPGFGGGFSQNQNPGSGAGFPQNQNPDSGARFPQNQNQGFGGGFPQNQNQNGGFSQNHNHPEFLEDPSQVARPNQNQRPNNAGFPGSQPRRPESRPKESQRRPYGDQLPNPNHPGGPNGRPQGQNPNNFDRPQGGRPGNRQPTWETRPGNSQGQRPNRPGNSQGGRPNRPEGARPWNASPSDQIRPVFEETFEPARPSGPFSEKQKFTDPDTQEDPTNEFSPGFFGSSTTRPSRQTQFTSRPQAGPFTFPSGATEQTTPPQRTRPTRRPPATSTLANDVLPEATTPVSACVMRCQVTPEFNPVCGTDSTSYNNPGKLKCAQRCGKDVTILHYGNCIPAPASSTEATLPAW